MKYTVEWNSEKRKRITEEHNSRADEIITNAIEYLKDPCKNERKKLRECRYCYYLYHSRLGLQAFTDANCGLCGKIQHFSSSVIDKLCEDCAKKTSSCKHCGGEFD